MKKSFLSADTRVIILPGIYLLVLVVLYYIVVKTGLEKFAVQRRDLQNSKKIEATLLDKYNTLSQAQSQIEPFLTPSTYALPEKNPALMIIGQLRNQTETKGVSMEDFKIGSTLASGKEVSELTVGFQTTGDFFQTMEFLNGLKDVSPIITVEKLRLSFISGVVSAEVSLKSYWSDFPQELPSVTDPIAKITEDEYTALQLTANLIQPTFTSLSPSGPYFRSSPF